MANINSRQRRQIRRESAKIRQEAYDALTDEEKLQRLLDNGHEQCHEVGKLRQRIETSADSVH